MSRHDFTPQEFGQRRSALAEALRRRGLDWLIVIHPRGLHWLTGCRAKGYQAFQCAFMHASGGLPVILTRVSEQFEVQAEAEVCNVLTWGDSRNPDPFAAFAQAFAGLGLPGQQVALERPEMFLSETALQRLSAACAHHFADGTGIIDDLRLIKSPAEQAYIRKAGQIADNAMAAIPPLLGEGRTELALAGAIYNAAMGQGGDIPASPINLSAGPRAVFSHGAPSERALLAGDHGNAEVGLPYRGYPVSIGRLFCIGPVAARLSDLHGQISAALDAGIKTCADGVPAQQVFAAVEAVLSHAGIAQMRVHTMGYAMATAFPPATGEAFHISPANNQPLREGMQIALCPNLFCAAKGLGLRLVDNVLITKTGAERLTEFPREIIEGGTSNDYA